MKTEKCWNGHQCLLDETDLQILKTKLIYNPLRIRGETHQKPAKIKYENAAGCQHYEKVK